MTNVFKRLAGFLLACLFLFQSAPALALEGIQEGEVIYQVFVRAFSDSDGDGTGDFRGLEDKLDYLADLGIGALWLMPVHPSPSYHGYDVTDYRGVNPDYGSMADFTALLSAAHARGIRVLLDVPFNHTSSRHPWFVSSMEENSPHRSWYHWAREGQEGFFPDLTVWGQQPWKKRGDAYYYAIFWEGMPDLNFNSQEVRNEVQDIARFWLALGVDGFRLDATSHIFGEGELQRLQDIQASADFWVDFSAEVKAYYPKAHLMGEAWEPLSKRAEIIRGLDSLVNFDLGDRLLPMLKNGGSGAALVSLLDQGYAAYRASNPQYVDAPFLSNHDQNRVASVLAMRQDKLALAARILLTLPGTPILYYGEEIGMGGAKPDEELRTPMLWGAGDPATTSWHPSRYNNRTVPVAEQLQDPASLLNAYRQMIHLRREQPALQTGSFVPYASENTIPLAFWRQLGDVTLLVLHNPSPNEQVIQVPEDLIPCFGTPGTQSSGGQATLPAFSTLIVSNEEKYKP